MVKRFILKTVWHVTGQMVKVLLVLNLTDEYWLHGGTPKAIFHTINEGVPENGMIGKDIESNSSATSVELHCVDSRNKAC
jgi:hypothetical protein